MTNVEEFKDERIKWGVKREDFLDNDQLVERMSKIAFVLVRTENC